MLESNSHTGVLTMDWNWFFSSLSQSAAAIVGIFGAFIVSKTLGNQSLFQSKSNQLETILAESENIKAEAKDLYFNWYNNKTNDRALDKLADRIQDEPSILSKSPETIFSELNFSEYSSRDKTLSLISETIEKYIPLQNQYEADLKKADIEKLRISDLANHQGDDLLSHMSRGLAGLASFQQYTSFPQPPNLSPYDTLAKQASLTSLLPELERELERIDLVRRKASHQVKLNSNFLRSVNNNPERSLYITATLLLISVLFFAGVIYPVSFLPLTAGQEPSISLSAIIPTLLSLKGAMLSLISVIFCVIPAIFLRLNNSFKYNSEQIKQLKAFCEIRAFSENFHFYEMNTAKR